MMIKCYIKHRIITALLLLGLFLFQLICFALYGLPVEAVLYPSFLYFVIIAVITGFDYCRFAKKSRHLAELASIPENLLGELEQYGGAPDEDYRRIVEALEKQVRAITAQDDGKYSEMVDYYTLWCHQIKTPIASMRLTLQNEDSAASRKLSRDLTDIEQYVEMVLCYLRLDSDYTDYVFKEHSLDEIIKAALRNYAGQFISKGISLDYKPLEKTVLTDEKWLVFVIGQILSNSLKYTNSGSVGIYIEEKGEKMSLLIKDSGIGIATEDLPRIFDKGYTGFNGRSDKKASGLGLYLCKRICDSLGLNITAESEKGVGTTLRIDFPSEKRIHE